MAPDAEMDDAMGAGADAASGADAGATDTEVDSFGS
jgi:hypothetical protein